MTDQLDLTEIAEAVREYHVGDCTQPDCRLCVALVAYDRAREVVPTDATKEEVQAGLEGAARDLGLIGQAEEAVLVIRGYWLLAGRRLGIDYDTMGGWAGIGHAAVNKALHQARLRARERK